MRINKNKDEGFTPTRSPAGRFKSIDAFSNLSYKFLKRKMLILNTSLKDSESLTALTKRESNFRKDSQELSIDHGDLEALAIF